MNQPNEPMSIRSQNAIRIAQEKQKIGQLRGRNYDPNALVRRVGSKYVNSIVHDFYMTALRMSWSKLLLSVFGFYIVANVFFALLYIGGGDTINNAQAGSIEDAFFFSVQTLATIGYGGMTPKGTYSNILVFIESLIGLICIAVMTGIVFAKLARPSAKVLFSEHVLLSKHNGKPTLMFRLANERDSSIVAASIQVSALVTHTTAEGTTLTSIVDLPLVRSTSPIFTMSWLVMHHIDEKSPFYKYTQKQYHNIDALMRDDIRLAVNVVGTDLTVSQQVSSLYMYMADDFRINARFIDVIHQEKDPKHAGRRVLDLTKFHDVETLPEEHWL